MRRISLVVLCTLTTCITFAQQWSHSLILDTMLDRHFALSVSGTYLYDGTTKGLFQYDGAIWRGPFIIPDTLSWEANPTAPNTTGKTSVIRYVAPIKSTSDVWVATVNAISKFDGATHVFSETAVLFPSPDQAFLTSGLGANGTTISDITTDKNNNLLVAVANYVICYDGTLLDTMIDVTGQLTPSSGFIKSLLVRGDSLWVATSRQLFLFNGGQLVERIDSFAGIPKKPLNGGRISSRLGLDTDGSLWFVSDYGLVKSSDTGWVHFPTQNADHEHHRWRTSTCSAIVGSSVLGIKVYDKAQDTIVQIFIPYLSEVFDVAFWKDTIYLAGPHRLLSGYSKKWACTGTPQTTNTQLTSVPTIKLYPNPGRDVVMESDEPLTISIVDILGRPTEYQSTTYETNKHIKNLPSGVYMVTLTTQKGITYTKKLIIE